MPNADAGGTTPPPRGLTEEQKRDWITEPENLRGRTPEEIKRMVPEGWVENPSREGEGTRWANPERRGEQVRVQRGMPDAPAETAPVKRGPYARTSRDGRRSDPIPLAGNPTLGEGPKE